MKISILRFYLLVIVAATTFGCEDYLDEENRSAISIEDAISDAATLDKLVNAVYDKMRSYSTCYDLNNGDQYNLLEEQGTDIVTRGGPITGTSDLNDYVNFNSTNNAVALYWNNYYEVIAAANLVIDTADVINGVGEAEVTKAIGEAKFFRAWSYFNLAENFGDVPLVLYPITTVQIEFVRTAEEAVYEQIVADLDDALAGVDEVAAAFGRVTKDAVRHLKSKVLLTRSYKTYAGPNDLTEAAVLAETVISNHPLVASYASLVDIENQRNSEVIFSFLFGSDAVSMGWGNSRHMMYKFEYFNYPGLVQSDIYHRGLGTIPTPFFYSLFSEEDERAEATFRRVIYALESTENGSIEEGDTAIYFPKTSWTEAEKAAVPYIVVNPGTYFTNDGFTDTHYPMFKKFDNPGVPFVWPDQPTRGTRDMIMMRSGEAYLVAAEAYLKSGSAGLAAEKINAIRSRAGISAPVTEAEVTTDLILNERARELAGEVSRWMDLKRTGTLIERVLAYNPHAALNNAITEKHYLRPIPQREIDISGISQNEDY